MLSAFCQIPRRLGRVPTRQTVEEGADVKSADDLRRQPRRANICRINEMAETSHFSSNRRRGRAIVLPFAHARIILTRYRYLGRRPWRVPIRVDSSGRLTVSTRLNQGLMWAAIVAAMAVTPVLTLAQREGGAAPGAQGAQGAPAGGGARGGGRG